MSCLKKHTTDVKRGFSSLICWEIQDRFYESSPRIQHLKTQLLIVHSPSVIFQLIMFTDAVFTRAQTLQHKSHDNSQ